MFFGGLQFGGDRAKRSKKADMAEGSMYEKTYSKASALSALSQISGSKRQEFLGVERSADPYDRTMSEEDARSYYTNPKNREYYRRMKTLQSVSRVTTIQMGGEELINRAAGAVVNVGNGNLLVRETVRLGDVTLKKGDHLECMSDHQVFNKTSMREHKLLDALAEAYQYNAARDGYRRPGGYTTPTAVDPSDDFNAAARSAPEAIARMSTPYKREKPV